MFEKQKKNTSVERFLCVLEPFFALQNFSEKVALYNEINATNTNL